MYKIILASGIDFPCDWCGAIVGHLRVNIPGEYSLLELAQVFSDAGNTAKITFQYGEMQTVHEGFTRLIALQDGGWSDGAILVTLRRETDE